MQRFANQDTAQSPTLSPCLDVEAQHVVQWEVEAGDRGEEIEGVMRTVEVVIVEEETEAV